MWGLRLKRNSSLHRIVHFGTPNAEIDTEEFRSIRAQYLQKIIGDTFHGMTCEYLQEYIDNSVFHFNRQFLGRPAANETDSSDDRPYSKSGFNLSCIAACFVL